MGKVDEDYLERNLAHYVKFINRALTTEALAETCVEEKERYTALIHQALSYRSMAVNIASKINHDLLESFGYEQQRGGSWYRHDYKQ